MPVTWHITLSQMASFCLPFAQVQYCREVAASRYSGVYAGVSHAFGELFNFIFDWSNLQILVDVLLWYVPRGINNITQYCVLKCLDNFSLLFVVHPQNCTPIICLDSVRTCTNSLLCTDNSTRNVARRANTFFWISGQVKLFYFLRVSSRVTWYLMSCLSTK